MKKFTIMSRQSGKTEICVELYSKSPEDSFIIACNERCAQDFNLRGIKSIDAQSFCDKTDGYTLLNALKVKNIILDEYLFFPGDYISKTRTIINRYMDEFLETNLHIYSSADGKYYKDVIDAIKKDKTESVCVYEKEVEHIFNNFISDPDVDFNVVYPTFEEYRVMLLDRKLPESLGQEAFEIQFLNMIYFGDVMKFHEVTKLNRTIKITIEVEDFTAVAELTEKQIKDAQNLIPDVVETIVVTAIQQLNEKLETPLFA